MEEFDGKSPKLRCFDGKLSKSMGSCSAMAWMAWLGVWLVAEHGGWVDSVFELWANSEFCFININHNIILYNININII